MSSPVQPDLASSPILPQQQQPPQQLLPLPLQDLSKRSTKRGLVTELNQQENRFSDASENSFLDPVENSTPVKMPCRRQLDERLAGFPGTPLREEKTPLKSNVMATPQRQEQVQQQHPETPRSSRPSLADITSLDSNSKRVVVISPDSNRPVQQKKRWLMQAAMEQATKTAILQFNSPTSTGTLSPSRTNNMGPEELAREIVWSHDEKQEPKEIPHRGRSPLKSSSSSVVRGPEALQSPRRRRERSPDTMTVAAALVYMGNDKETAAMGQEQQQQHAQAAPSQLNLEDERQLQQLPSEDVPLNLSMPKIIDY